MEPAISPESNPGRGAKFAWVGLLVVVVALVGAYLVLRKPTKPAPPTNQLSDKAPAEVSITKAGFTPATVSVEVGQSVNWTNDDSQPHRVASDPFPSNDGLPGFDSQQMLAPGDSYSYTFEKPGTFGYHDQKNPTTLQGQVIVH